jgi:hypothetical protein
LSVTPAIGDDAAHVLRRARLAREDRVCGRHGEQREEHRDEHPVEHDDADRPPLLRSGAAREQERQRAERSAEARHQHGPQPRRGGADERVDERDAAVAKLVRELDDQNAVLGCDADQHDHRDLAEDVHRESI